MLYLSEISSKPLCAFLGTNQKQPFFKQKSCYIYKKSNIFSKTKINYNKKLIILNLKKTYNHK